MDGFLKVFIDKYLEVTGGVVNAETMPCLLYTSYKKERVLAGKPYFSVASGGGTGRTLHPDNMAAGPAPPH